MKARSCWQTKWRGRYPLSKKEIVAILDASSRNLQKLIEQLLDYNRKLADGAVVLESVEIEPLVDMVISAHSLPARAKMMHTRVDLNAPSCLGRADAPNERTG